MFAHAEDFSIRSGDFTDSSSASTMYSISPELALESAFCENNNIIDEETPWNEELSAHYKRSSAYYTMRENAPSLLRDLVQWLKQNEKPLMKRYGDYARYDLRRILWSLDILRDDLTNNKPFKLFHGKEPDTENWNKFLSSLPDDRNQWFTSVWLHAQCYLYRRISTIFKRTETLCHFDYFSHSKMTATRQLVYVMLGILKATRNMDFSHNDFEVLLKLSVWGNRCDLSIQHNPPEDNIMTRISGFDSDLLLDQSDDILRVLKEARSPVFVDIVCDNAGYELFTDLILGEYLFEAGLARQVRYHVKAIPSFVSDATVNDFRWTLRYLRTHAISELAAFGNKIHGFMKDKFFVLSDLSHFWTSPHSCSSMRKVLPCLYVRLSQSALVIFKGDEHFRRLLGDINPHPAESFVKCLKGFLPTSICSLRVIKSNIFCGMQDYTMSFIREEDSRWMLTGEKAVIQLAEKISP
ncbi:damage-control phosphatase ARMT1 [Scaptodrosophila lebanonensis]|uniref:Sugar phosphate phosphatase n=1 Tax=Drosophila lebanonensis TaxID=7225 RepID=A0A6J2TJF8_DROLE|nr:damage-control phosphatase ARMT1 [Scaptodrosophila lebanonensis]